MAFGRGPSITKDGLVLALDAANVKSFRGEPTVNIAANGGLIGMSGITLTFINEEDGWKKFSMSGTFTGGSYPYIMYVTPVVFTSGLTYTTKCIIKTNAISKFNYFGSGMNYVNEPMNNGGISSSTLNIDGSFTISRTGFSYTNTTTQPGYLLTNPINNTTFNQSSDFVWIKELQIEEKPYATPFVNGTRGTTVATGGGWVDRSGNSNHGELVNGPTFNLDNLGSIKFDGVNDYINLSTNIQSGYTSASYEFFLETGNITTSEYRQIYIQENSTWIALYAVSGVVFFGIDLNNGSGWFDGNGGWNTGARTTSTITSNTKYHLVYTWSGLSVKVYLNGVLQSTTSTLQASNGRQNVTQLGNGTTPRRIGSRNNQFYWNNKIFKASFYNRLLSDSEVLQNYNATKGRYGL
jgi:hypothetical protein